MYNTKKSRISYSYFLGDFLIFLLLSFLLSLCCYGPVWLVVTHHHAAVAEQKTSITAQNTFWQAVSGEHPAPDGSNLERFTSDFHADLQAAKHMAVPGLTNHLPTKLTATVVPVLKYGNLAYTSRTYIWGQAKGETGTANSTSYLEGGPFSQSFLNQVDQLVSGSPAVVKTLSHQPVPIPGHTVPPIPTYWYVLWGFALTTLAYVFAAIDLEHRSFFSIARSPNVYWINRLWVTLLAFPVGVVLWSGLGYEKIYMKHSSRQLIKKLNDPGNPLHEQTKAVRAILAKYKDSKFLHLPEVKSAFDTAKNTLDSLQYAEQHRAENNARKAAVDDMEALLPHAMDAKVYHETLHAEMQEDTTVRLAELRKQLQNLFGAPNVIGPAPTAKTGNPLPKGAQTAQVSEVIMPEDQ